jgi:ABC-type amino acid transport system permease subunit
MKQCANWMAWTLQFIFGFVVGAIIGLRGLGGRSAYSWECASGISFVLGVAFLGAALASYFGDRLWMGSCYSVLPPEPAQHSVSSRIASVITGMAGIICIVLPRIVA